MSIGRGLCLCGVVLVSKHNTMGTNDEGQELP
jgi:hypothetical protein